MPVIASDSLFSTSPVSVSLTLDLPASIAEEVQQIQQQDPVMLSRIVTYGVTRAAIFETLLEKLSPTRV